MEFRITRKQIPKKHKDGRIMPTRMIREGLLDSDKINLLSADGERLFTRLMLCADDFGRFDGRFIVIKNRAFPLKETMKISNIEKDLNECIKVGLITRYLVNGKPYIEIPGFNQRLRAKKSKYPDNDGHMSDDCPTDDGHVQATINKMSEEKRREEKGSEENYKSEFDVFRKLYIGSKNGLDTEYKNLKKHKDYREIIPLLLPSLEKEYRYKEILKSKKEFCPPWKNLQTWINNRCWEQEFTILKEQTHSSIDMGVATGEYYEPAK